MLFFILILQSYLVMALLVFAIFLRSFLQDPYTPHTDRISWLVIGFSTIFWPIVLPLTHLERQTKKNRKNPDFYKDFDWSYPGRKPKKNNVIAFPYWRLKARSLNPNFVNPSYTLHIISSHRIQRKIRP